MSIVTERDRKLLSDIIAIIKPANSLAARLDKLTDEQFDSYTKWTARYERWIGWCKARHDDEIEVDARPYAYALQGHEPPALRRAVRIAVYGPDLKPIPATASDDDAARIYKEYCDEQR